MRSLLVSAGDCDRAEFVVLVLLGFEFTCAPNLRIGGLPASGNEADAGTEICHQRIFVHRAAVAKGISIEKNVASYRAAVDRTKSEEPKIAMKCDAWSLRVSRNSGTWTCG